jgi:hypothetical protein
MKQQQKNEQAKKLDNGKLRLDLISIPALNGVAEILGNGVFKYGERNWEKGMSWSRCFGALLSHLFAWWIGEDIDKESGLPHINHAFCNLMFLVHYAKLSIGNDDRPIKK